MMISLKKVLNGKLRGPHFPIAAWIIGGILVMGFVLSAGCMETSAARPLSRISEDVPYPRIICLSSDTAELLVIIGAGDHIVGVPDSLIRHQPELYRLLPNAQNIGDAKKPDNEKVIDLSPDYILFISAMKPSTADKWEAAGIHVMPVESHKAEDLSRAARMLGNLTGHERKAAEYAEFNDRLLSFVQSRIGSGYEHRPRIYIESYSDYVAYGNVSAANTILDFLKAESISGQVFSNATRVSSEWINREDPEILVKVVIPDTTKTLESEYARIRDREGFDRLRAVRDGHVYVISGNLLFSPHASVGILYLAKALYPDAFADINPDDVLQEYAGMFMPGTGQQPTIHPVPWK